MVLGTNPPQCVCVQVPGNFHVSTHSATAQPQNPDMTHTIHKLAFGEKLQVGHIFYFILFFLDGESGEEYLQYEHRSFLSSLSHRYRKSKEPLML